MKLELLKQFKPYSISPGYNTERILYGTSSLDMIEGTTYTPTQESYKAVVGIVHSFQYSIHHVFYDDYILFAIKNECYIEYHLKEHQFYIACINQHSPSLYTLLLCAINYLYNEYHIDQFKSIYTKWRKINMMDHIDGQNWDAPEYQYVLDISKQLVNILNDVIVHSQDFLSLHYDSVEELLEHYNIELDPYNLSQTFLFQQQNQYHFINTEKETQILHQFNSSKTAPLLDITPLYSDEEIKQLPLFLQESIKDNQNIYINNREFLDQNDFDLIKSLKRGKTWSCLYYGPSGTGKTTKILAVAGALGLPSMKIVGSRSIDEATLFGKYVLKNGETVFEYGPLTLMMKYGGMFIFDEINMVDSDIVASLNDVLDGTKQKILDNGEIIHAHPHFRFAESMNIGYAGTNEMNISHKSRIQNKIKISKLSIEKMTQIIVKESCIDVDIAKKMASLLDHFNNIIMNEGNETTQRIDLRTLIHWAHKTVDLDGDVIRASLTTVIAELSEEDDDILNLEDIVQIMGTSGPAGLVMSQIVHEFSNEDTL